MAKPAPHLRRAAPARFAIPVAAQSASPNVGIVRESSSAVDPVPAIANLTPFQKPSIAQVVVDAATVEDLDLLWDWARSDRDGVGAFLSESHKNSQAFFAHVSDIFAAEQRGTAWFRAVRREGELVGFVMLNPISQNKMATLHLYLAPSAPTSVIESVLQAVPQNLALALVAPSEEFANLFVSLGFESKIVLTRPPLALE